MGWAQPGDAVTVMFDNTKMGTVADADGRWAIQLPPHSAGGPYSMTVSTRLDTREMRSWYAIRGIFVGDVWLCAGQSNMWWPVRDSRDAAREIKAAHDLRIAYFEVPHIRSDLPVGELAGGAWHEAVPNHVGDFSAVAYYFARQLRRSVDVPIGLILVTENATPIEPFLSSQAMALTGVPDTVYRSRVYNGMVHPLLRYTIKGVVWYQGENNTLQNVSDYRRLFPSLIRDWRRAWEQGDFPFLFVQLPAYGGKGVQPESWALVREAQEATLALPNTAQAVTIDLGDRENIHPDNKQDVGARLALAARRVAYGHDIEYSGPIYRHHTIVNGRVTIEFDHVGRGLVAKGLRALKGFVIAGADGRFVPANSIIEKNYIVAWSREVSSPTAVRYAWANYPVDANLYNTEGLPASPFRTDREDSQ